MNNYRKTIQVGSNVTDIIKLPCVFGVHKEADGSLCYLFRDFDVHDDYVKFRKGDWLCEGYDGRWCVVTEKEYKQLKG